MSLDLRGYINFDMSATLPTDSSIPSEMGHERKSSRKQWSVQGGPRGLLRRMRSQLAEDGCPESQLVMGRALLQQLEDNDCDEEDARLALFWLTQASLQGNEEATELLQDCLNKNIGICEHNYHEIRECLAMDLQEKLARRAAHLLFNSLSNGNEFITSCSLSMKLNNLISCAKEEDHKEFVENNVQEEKKEGTACNNLEERYGGERFSEEHLVSASVFYCEGRVPPLHHYITSISSTQSQVYQALSLPYKLILKVYSDCVNFLGITLTNQIRKVLSLANPLSNIIFLLITTSLLIILGSKIYSALPVIVACTSFIIMMVSSAHMLLIRKRFDSFHMWSLVFSQYCPELDTLSLENRFKSRCWKPYVSYFVAMFFYVATLPLIPSQLQVSFLPSMCIFSALTLCLLPEKLNVLYFISLVVHALCITNFANYDISLMFSENGIELDGIFSSHYIYLDENIKLNVSANSIVHSIWCCSCLIVLLRYGVTILVPHLVTLTWCHLSIIAVQSASSPNDLIIPATTWSVLIFLPFITPFILTLVPGLSLTSLLLYSGFEIYICITVFLIVTVFTALLRKWWPSFTFICKVLLSALVLIFILQPSYTLLPLSMTELSNLKWESYKNVCWPSKDISALTQHRCSSLEGVLVKWQGSITQVEIIDVWNLPQTFLKYVPTGVEKSLRCYLGKKVGPCPYKDLMNHDNYCSFIQSALGSDTCILDDWNEYTFEITVAMSLSSWKFGSSSSLIKIITDHSFHEFVLSLHIGDEVEFVGSLFQNVGSQSLKMQMSSIKCINCKLKLKSVNKYNELPYQFNFWAIPTFIFNFVMNPILTI